MNSAFVLCAYFAMLLSPCVVASYGDLLSVRWIFALIRRRRTHAAESFLVSFTQERYAMALADEAAFFALHSEEHFAPQPFLVPMRVVPVETAGFLEARQRVAARLAQLTVVHKLRAAADTPDVAAPLRANTAASSSKDVHIRPRKIETVLSAHAAHEAAHTHLVSRPASMPAYELVEVAAAPESMPARSGPGPEPVPPRPRRKPGESDVMEIAA